MSDSMRRRSEVRQRPAGTPALPESVRIILPRKRKINPWHILLVLGGLALLATGAWYAHRKLNAPEPEPEPQVEMREVEVAPPLPEPEPDLEPREDAEPSDEAAAPSNDLLARGDAPAGPGNPISLDLALGTGADGMAVGGGGGGGGKRFAYEPGQVDQEPQVTQEAPPELPRKAAEQGVSGSFVATFVVGAAGKVEAIQITGSPQGYGYEDAIRKALLKRRYKPAMAGGVAVPMKIRQPFDFRLE